MPTAECPNRSTLFDYLAGKLPDETSDSLSTHVESCPDCQAELATLSDIEDTLIGQLRGAPLAEPYLDESECGRAIAKAKGVAEEGKGDSPRLPESQTSLPTHLGEYRLIERLGSGGMGAVYKAVHGRLDRVVALKILPRTRTDSRAVVRFEREIKAIGRLDHPHIVRAYDAREIDERLVLVMEFVEGLDLGKLVRRLGKGDITDFGELGKFPSRNRPKISDVPFSDACELARQAALGLQVAHEHGMVHRDVKPSNLMLTPEGQVKLLDLGLARFQGGLSQWSPVGAASVGTAVELPSQPSDDDMTGSGQAMGTADYMAPEQTSDSRTVDIRADIYSLGATLYKLLSGRAPFSGPEYESAFDKMLAHRQTPPPPIEQFCPSIPDALAAVLNRMLAKDPAARYQTPNEVAEALAPFCPGSDLPALLQAAENRIAGVPPASSNANVLPAPDSAAAPSGRDARAPKPRRWRTIVAAAVALLLLSSVGGLGYWLGVTIHIRNQHGEEATLKVPNGSDVAVDDRGEATLTLPGAPSPPRARTPAAALDANAQTPASATRTPRAAAPAVNAVAEYRALLGQWKVVRVEKGNGADSDWARILGYTDSAVDPATASRFRFDEAELHILSFETAQTWQFGFRFDPFTRIKQLDLTSVPDNMQEGLRALGIYELKDGRLKIRLARVMPALSFDQRPSSFAVDPNSGDIQFTLERLRPSKDEQAFERSGGRWAVTSQIDDGKPIADGQRSHREWTFADNNFSILICGKDANGVKNSEFCPMSGLYRLNADNQPKQITLFAEIGSGAGKFERKNFQGIYKFDGGRLTIAYREGDKPPQQFEAKPGSHVTLLALERLAKAAPTAPMPVVMPSLPEVSVCRPVLRHVTDYLDFTGHSEASQTVEVRSRVAGELVKVAFAGGAKVKQGDVLFEIDPRRYQAELEKRTADLSAARTRAQHAAAELERAKALAKSRAISTSDMDRVESEQKEAQAAALAAEADLKLAKLNLDYATIRAPIGGVISRPQLSVGSLVAAGTQTLATIVSSDPLYVVFFVDERSGLDLRRQAVEEKAKTGRELPIEVRFGTADEKDYPHHCTIESKGEQINPASGVASWRATLPNPDGLLMPGMFARVRLLIGSPRQALLIPEEVLAFDQGRRFVFVVGEKNTVERRDLEIGQSDGDLRVVKAGLTADDRVVVSQQKLQAGMIVKPKLETPPGSPPPPISMAADKGGKQEKPLAAPTPFRTATVTRGDIAATVYAAGTIEPEELVDVGAAVAGQVISLGLGSDGKPIDYMSPVNQGTILASIDPTVYKARVDQEEAALRHAQAEVALAEARGKSQTPEVARASLQAARATLLQCESALALAKRNLDCTTIRSPVKGVIIDRRVNVGQNVGVSAPNASCLFLIAKDLKKMQVWAMVNEADIARIRKGMEARFTVDAFPKETFKGTVTQIRMNAAVIQNVVVYTVVVGFDNSDLKLVPYLTANVQFQVEKRSNVLRVPNAALRWKPVPDLVGANAATPEAQGAMRSLPPGTALWIKTADGRHVQRIPINVGLSDGLLSEVSGPDVKEGMEIVIGQRADGNNPFVPRFFPR